MPLLCLIELNAACMASCVSACLSWEVLSIALHVPLKLRCFLLQLTACCGMLIVPCGGATCTYMCCRYQIVDFPNMNTTQVDNGTWQVGDYVDTLLMPEFASEARVRWIPGPINITGGQAALGGLSGAGLKAATAMDTSCLSYESLTLPKH